MKQKLILDFDGTIVNFSKAYCHLYNYLFCEKEGYKPADWWNVKKWNLVDECPLAVSLCKNMFEHEKFFQWLDFFPDAPQTLLRLHEKYQLVICTIGTPKNIALKVLWIEENLSFIKDLILISNDGSKIDKSIVDMGGSIFLDDVSSNLLSSNASLKLCYGKVQECNEDWEGLRVNNWRELECFLLGEEVLA